MLRRHVYLRTAPAISAPPCRVSTDVRCAQGFDPNPKPPPKKKAVVEVEAEFEDVSPSSNGGLRREVPTSVANRVLGRIAIFSGVPVLTGVCLLPFFYYLKVVKGLDVPTWIVFVSQVLTFGGGLLGISYAILSSSADAQQDFLGVENFKENVKDMIGKD